MKKYKFKTEIKSKIYFILYLKLNYIDKSVNICQRQHSFQIKDFVLIDLSFPTYWRKIKDELLHR